MWSDFIHRKNATWSRGLDAGVPRDTQKPAETLPVSRPCRLPADMGEDSPFTKLQLSSCRLNIVMLGLAVAATAVEI